jgi:hypothetical protein
MICGRLKHLWRILRLALCGICLVAGLRAQNGSSPSRDTLVYKDGDRLQGVLVQQTAETITFKSDRFGEVKVPAKDAVVIKGRTHASRPAAVAATPPAPKPAPGAKAAATPAAKPVATASETAEEERVSLWDRFSPAVLTARVRNYFGPWQGRLSLSTEVVSDTAERNNSSYEGSLQRKWKADEVRFSLRYDYNETNDVATTDLVRSSGQWRRTFTKAVFGHYRPSAEWNRASRLRGLPNDYLLMQQELGAGYNLLALPTRKFRLGMSQNLFDRWSLLGDGAHDSRGVVSAFQEADLTLPWRITISQRGVWYPVREDADGWENRVELNKKLTETLSTSLRHEIRRNNPDGTAQDYTRLKVMLGLDF